MFSLGTFTELRTEPIIQSTHFVKYGLVKVLSHVKSFMLLSPLTEIEPVTYDDSHLENVVMYKSSLKMHYVWAMDMSKLPVFDKKNT